MHFSFADQVSAVANARYAAESNLCVVEIDAGRLDQEIRVEDSYGSGEEYPHLYGPIPVRAAVAVHDLDRAPDGSYRFSLADGDAAASPGR